MHKPTPKIPGIDSKSRGFINRELALLAVSLTVAIAIPAAPVRATPLAKSPSTDVPTSNQIAPVPANCRRTSVQVPIGVRREPSFDSDLVGVLLRGTRVSIENLGANGWVPISAPYQGYVYAGYLTECGPSPTVPL
jgi:hypothetical protein